MSRKQLTSEELLSSIIETWAQLDLGQPLLAKKGGKLKKKNKIYIKPENKGKFTKSAKAAGQSVQGHAHSVLNNPNATKLQKKRAQFAVNSTKWH